MGRKTSWQFWKRSKQVQTEPTISFKPLTAYKVRVNYFFYFYKNWIHLSVKQTFIHNHISFCMLSRKFETTWVILFSKPTSLTWIQKRKREESLCCMFTNSGKMGFLTRKNFFWNFTCQYISSNSTPTVILGEIH